MIQPFLRFGIIFLTAQIVARAGATEISPLTATPLDNDILRVRVQHLTDDFAAQLLAAQPTNKPRGVILDLRSADGEKNALPSAGGFFADKNVPLVILVNSQTRGAAALFAADLRSAGDGILVGNTDFTGKTQPDILVAVTSEDEKKFLADPFFNPAPPKNISLSSTNELAPFVDHMSEAELVRERVKDGEEDDAATPRVEPGQPVIRDPALARAVDLLKALALLKPARG